uniref:Uncharacterized protein n=1 Tax=Phaeomonas parva TaxID=124430 RepID=A0A7S1TWB5_9STRA|mmetsp:Transcript_20823/g.63388  ORF Transcript_20823/g.63388 Transcript_20823/m.63388 type:complete len:243 (+) Transcript_20823:87-815(+)
MDAALLKQLQTAPRRGAAGSAPSPAPLEHPSNAPFKERYEKAYVVASKRKRWAAQEHAEEVSENDRIQDPMAARIELGQTRDDIGTGTWTGGLVLARLLEALCDEPLPGISGRLEDLCTGVDVEPGPSTGPVSPAVAAKPFITDAARALPVVELGSGTGVGGLGAALFAGFLDVTLTDRPGEIPTASPSPTSPRSQASCDAVVKGRCWRIWSATLSATWPSSVNAACTPATALPRRRWIGWT